MEPKCSFPCWHQPATASGAWCDVICTGSLRWSVVSTSLHPEAGGPHLSAICNCNYYLSRCHSTPLQPKDAQCLGASWLCGFYNILCMHIGTKYMHDMTHVVWQKFTSVSEQPAFFIFSVDYCVLTLHVWLLVPFLDTFDYISNNGLLFSENM